MRFRVRYRDRILEPTVADGHRIVWDDHQLRIEGSAARFECDAFLVQSVSLADEEDQDPGVQSARDRRQANQPRPAPTHR